MKKINYKQKFVHLFNRVNATSITENFAITEFNLTSPVVAPVIPESESVPSEMQQSSTPVTKREVRHLRVGDVLSGTGGKVVQAPVAGLKTPPGKMEIVIQYPNGRTIGKIWGKYSIVGIKPVDNKNTLTTVDNSQTATDIDIPLSEGETPVLEFKPKAGFWDVTKYVYGGHFDRFMGGEQGRLIPGTVKMGDEIRVTLEDGRTVVCSASAVSNMEFDDVLELAKANGRQVV